MSASLVQALKDCGSARDLQRGKTIHNDAVQSGAAADLLVATTLVSMYSKCGSMADARKVFDAMPSRNLVSWIVLALGYAHNREFELALGFFHRIDPFIASSAVDRSSLLAAIAACRDLAAKGNGSDRLRRSCLEKGREIHRIVAKNGFEGDEVVASSLVDMYVKCGNLDDALRVFRCVPSNNVVSWTAIVLGYVGIGEFAAALENFARMQLEGCHPVARSFVAAIKACSGLAEKEDELRSVSIGSLRKGRAIHAQATCRGCDQVLFVQSSLVEMYIQCGSLDDARRVFDGIPRNNVVSWTTMMLGYVRSGEGNLALEMFARMQQEGVIPDAKTFTAAVQACSCLAAAGDGDDGRGNEVLLRKV